MIKIIIAEDHHLVRQGLKALLEKESDIQVVGEAADGYEALRQVQKFQPDILLLDMAMPLLSGAQTLEHLIVEANPVKVIVLSMYSEVHLVQQMLGSGARGYLLKNSLKEDLVLAIQAVMHGEIYLSEEIAHLETSSPKFSSARPESPFDVLTMREREVLKLIAEGHTNTKIAGILHLSVKTVEKHRANLLAKLNVSDTAALIRIAIQYHLVFLDSME